MSVFSWENNPPEQLLATRFSITTGLYPEQRIIIEKLVKRQRILVIQPTGWGKSLCYQMTSLYYPSLTIVFSPLKALMRDQCQHCNDHYKIPASIISSDNIEEENRIILEKALQGSIKILYIAPEILDNSLWQQYVYKFRISMIVVDEAHCISTWGHDFRPAYRRIINLLQILPPTTPIIALTATANQRVEQDILEQMGQNMEVIRGTMMRRNLLLHVTQINGDEAKLSYTADHLKQLLGPGIIYTATRKDAEMVAAFLQHQGIKAEYYHADRDSDLKRSQEIGRAGRDGKPAYCILLYDPNDISIQRYFIEMAQPNSIAHKRVLELLRIPGSPKGEQKIMLETGYSQPQTRAIIGNLREQGFIEQAPNKRGYVATFRSGTLDFTSYDIVHQQKIRELSDIQSFTGHSACFMQRLASYLGDQHAPTCGQCSYCQPDNFPDYHPSQRIETAVTHFLEYEWLPPIEKRGTEQKPEHEAGWALSYHSSTRIGQLVKTSKYEGAGPFSTDILNRAVEVIRSRYPLAQINGVVSVPSTKSGNLVEQFAHQLAEKLNLEYKNSIVKTRVTQAQKNLNNRSQKRDNVTGAFSVLPSSPVRGRTLLLVDDIYDSGWTMREVSRVLIQAGAQTIYPFTITRTRHSDDQ